MQPKKLVRPILEAITILDLLVVLAMFVLSGSGGVHRRTRRACMNHMRNVSMALQVYATNNNGELPPAYIADENGKPMHSWRVLLLPCIGHQDLYDRYNFDEPWDGPNNSKLAALIRDVYRCTDEYDTDDTSPWTSFVAVVGPHTM